MGRSSGEDRGGPGGPSRKKGNIEKKTKKLMIFMLQMQYNAPNRMHVFQNFSGTGTRGPPFGAVTQNRVPSPQKSWLPS